MRWSDWIDENLILARLPGSRMGLARARLLGVEKATAPILLFLDSHCEVVSRPLDNLLTVRSAR